MEEEKKIKESKIKQLMSMDVKDLKKILKKKSQLINKEEKENKNKVISFDIDEDYIRIVVGKYYKKELTIYKGVEIKTPQGCFEDGKILNQELLAKTLREAMSEYKIKAKYASVTTNSTQIINREIVIPKVEDDELETVINFEISRYLPINLNDCIVQTLMIDEIEVDGLEKLKVYAICYPEKIARSYFELINELNLKPYTLDIKFNSLNKIINYSQDINNEDYAMESSNAFINIESLSTDINIYKSGKIDFSRIIKQGYKTLEEYESMNDNASGADYLIEEIERIFQFYKNRVLGNKIEKVYLLGEGSRIENLDEYMSKKLDLKVEKIDNLGFIDFKSKEDNEIYKYLNAMGTIIRL